MRRTWDGVCICANDELASGRFVAGRGNRPSGISGIKADVVIGAELPPKNKNGAVHLFAGCL
jgi:hypothetical protein